MTRNQVKRAAMRFRRLVQQHRADACYCARAKAVYEEAYDSGMAFAEEQVARWLEGVLRRMKK